MRERSLCKRRHGPLSDDAEDYVACLVQHIAEIAQQDVGENQEDGKDDGRCGMTELVDDALKYQPHRHDREPRADYQDNGGGGLITPRPHRAPQVGNDAAAHARALGIGRHARRHSFRSLRLRASCVDDAP